jgi:hypothetical protein
VRIAAQAQSLVTGTHVPEFDRLVAAAGRKAMTVPGERQTLHVVGVPDLCTPQDRLPRPTEVPNPDDTILPRSGCRAADRAHEHDVDGASWPVSDPIRARAVVAGLWTMDDAATKALKSEFYVRLWDGMHTKLDALREAHLALLHNCDAAAGRRTRRRPRGVHSGFRSPGRKDVATLLLGGVQPHRPRLVFLWTQILSRVRLCCESSPRLLLSAEPLDEVV